MSSVLFRCLANSRGDPHPRERFGGVGGGRGDLREAHPPGGDHPGCVCVSPENYFQAYRSVSPFLHQQPFPMRKLGGVRVGKTMIVIGLL